MSYRYKIALTLRSSNSTSYFEERDAISSDWVKFIDGGGDHPVLIPNSLTDPVAFVKRENIDALILTNGEDFKRRYYKKPGNLKFNVYPDRDRTESVLLKWAIKNNIPTVAVCRGFQFVNVYMGGKLVSGRAKNLEKGINHVATTHTVNILDEKLRQLNKSERAKVNSYHNHGIVTDTLGKDLIPFAVVSDGTIEGFYLKNKPLIGIQWHPERKGPNNFMQKKLIKYFIENKKWW